MGVSLTKGGNVNLSRSAPGLRRLLVGLGWDARATVGTEFDLDASVFLLTESGAGRFRVRGDADMVFYNNPTSAEGAVVHSGDNRSGEGEGDDEVIRIDLSKMPADIVKVSVAVSIYEGEQRRQNFGMVSSAYIRVVNEDDGAELARFDLSEEASTETAMVFGEVYLRDGEWKFKAIGQGYAGGLVALCKANGLDVG